MFCLVTLFSIFIVISLGFPSIKFNDDESQVAKQRPEEMGEEFEGDMIFPESYIRGAPARPSGQRWLHGIVHYLMTSSISDGHQVLIVDAMRKLERLTMVNNTPCVQFHPKTSDTAYFIIIQNSTGCSATVGYNQDYTGNRYLNLMHTPTASCMNTGTIQHELVHVLGLYHEQSRSDRDNYINIQFSNIPSNVQYNFERYTDEQIDTLNTSYDYGSLMHYAPYAFSVNGNPTIIPIKNSTAIIGQRVTLSPTDILEIQRYYGCVPTPQRSSIGSRLFSLKSIILLFIVMRKVF